MHIFLLKKRAEFLSCDRRQVMSLVKRLAIWIGFFQFFTRLRNFSMSSFDSGPLLIRYRLDAPPSSPLMDISEVGERVSSESDAEELGAVDVWLCVDSMSTLVGLLVLVCGDGDKGTKLWDGCNVATAVGAFPFFFETTSEKMGMFPGRGRWRAPDRKKSEVVDLNEVGS